MNLEVSHLDNGIQLFKLSGRLDLQGANDIEKSFTTSINSGKPYVLIDMSEVEFLASTGMRLLLVNAKALAKRNGKMVLLKPQPLVKGALITVGFDELIPIYDDFDDAYIALKADISK